MTPKEIEEKYNKELLTQIAELKEHIAYVKNKENKQLNSNILYTFFDRKSHVLDLSVGESISSIEEAIKEFKSETKSLKKNLYYREFLEAEGSGYEDDTSIGFIELRAEWHEPKSEDNQYFKNVAMNRVASWIIQKLREERNVPSNQHFMVDCKILGLFKEGNIDYKTFCDITLANCKL